MNVTNQTYRTKWNRSTKLTDNHVLIHSPQNMADT